MFTIKVSSYDDQIIGTIGIILINKSFRHHSGLLKDEKFYTYLAGDASVILAKFGTVPEDLPFSLAYPEPVVSSLTSKGQFILKESLRDHLGVSFGARVVLQKTENRTIRLVNPDAPSVEPNKFGLETLKVKQGIIKFWCTKITSSEIKERSVNLENIISITPVNKSLDNLPIGGELLIREGSYITTVLFVSTYQGFVEACNELSGKESGSEYLPQLSGNLISCDSGFSW